MIRYWALTVIASISVLVIVGFAIINNESFNQFEIISQNEVVQDKTETIIKPQSITVIPTEIEIQVTETVVVPDINSKNSETHDTLSAKQIYPFFNSAFAIPSGQLAVTIDEWAVPTAFSDPFGITLDGSGNVYFTEQTGNKIGRLDPSTNVITEWTLPTASSRPNFITLDGSGNVYFAELTGNKIGRLDPSTNVITEWTVPTATSGPFGVTLDGSGNVYIAENNEIK